MRSRTIPCLFRSRQSEYGGNRGQCVLCLWPLNAMGYSVCAPEIVKPEEQKALGRAYSVIEQLTPLILANQGTGHMVGIRAPSDFNGTVDLAPQQFTVGGYLFLVHFRGARANLTAKGGCGDAGAHGGLIIQTGPDDFLVAGTGMVITFAQVKSRYLGRHRFHLGRKFCEWNMGARPGIKR